MRIVFVLVLTLVVIYTGWPQATRSTAGEEEAARPPQDGLRLSIRLPAGTVHRNFRILKTGRVPSPLLDEISPSCCTTNARLAATVWTPSAGIAGHP